MNLLAARLARWIAGSLLVVAAFLKARDLGLPPAGALDGRVVRALASNIECVLGFALLAALGGRLTWLFAIALFACFACIACFLWTAGRANCGCFGELSPRPAAMVTVDLCLVGALTVAGPSENRWSRFARTLACGAGVGGVALVNFVAIESLRTSQRDSLDGITILPGSRVILEPKAWIGKPFPQLALLQGDIDIRSGTHRVIFFSPTCPRCQAKLDHYARQAESNAAAGSGDMIVLVYVRSGDATQRERAFLATPQLKTVHLDPKKSWIVKTPTEVVVSDGIVTEVQ